jgi:hypothetical protein
MVKLKTVRKISYCYHSFLLSKSGPYEELAQIKGKKTLTVSVCPKEITLNDSHYSIFYHAAFLGYGIPTYRDGLNFLPVSNFEAIYYQGTYQNTQY